MTFGVYCIRHQPTGREYIGSSQDIEYRWREHRRALTRGEHFNPKLQNAWSKYGSEAFQFVVFEKTRDLQEAETLWIKYRQPYFNFRKPTRKKRRA